MLFLQTSTHQDSSDLVSDTFHMPGILATSLPLHWEREEEALCQGPPRVCQMFLLSLLTLIFIFNSCSDKLSSRIQLTFMKSVILFCKLSKATTEKGSSEKVRFEELRFVQKTVIHKPRAAEEKLQVSSPLTVRRGMPRAQPPTAHTEQQVGHAFRRKPSSPGLFLSSQKQQSSLGGRLRWLLCWELPEGVKCKNIRRPQTS